MNGAFNLFKEYLNSANVYNEIDETFWDEHPNFDIYSPARAEGINFKHELLKEKISPQDIKIEDFEYIKFGNVPRQEEPEPPPRDDEVVYLYKDYIMIDQNGITWSYGLCPH